MGGEHASKSHRLRAAGLASLSFHGRPFSANGEEAILTQSFDLIRLRRERAGGGLFHSRQPDLYTALMTLGGQSRND